MKSSESRSTYYIRVLSNCICNRIKAQLLSSTPISFTATIPHLEHDTEESSEDGDHRPSITFDQPTRTANLSHGPSYFSCFADGACLQDSSENIGGKEATSNTHYMTIDSQANDFQSPRTINLVTKPPKWNSELRQYIQNYGGRVKIPSYKNFTVVEVKQPEQQVIHYADEEQAEDHVCIRHGKVRYYKSFLEQMLVLICADTYRGQAKALFWTFVHQFQQ